MVLKKIGLGIHFRLFELFGKRRGNWRVVHQTGGFIDGQLDWVDWLRRWGMRVQCWRWRLRVV